MGTAWGWVFHASSLDALRADPFAAARRAACACTHADRGRPTALHPAPAPITDAVRAVSIAVFVDFASFVVETMQMLFL